ncbi:LolA-like outer membrane lipoprotein chaperone [Halarcobacter anaerophilus]|jgi:outer membrane lipoprotein carrier protein|uniref:LolA-like outer membrane lipoprotein chaperone n=1 Tax=Halarcobacter anaerophilus TaxID=877500 RepID=UPI0005C96C03|nr:LolA-like outer membrane lipoprotein chaperone [Halarcobacter anaerophilus]
MVYRISLLLGLLIVNCFANIDFEKIKTFKANFLQTVTNEAGKKVKYEGEVYIKKSGKVLWKYESPIKKDVYVIGEEVIINEPELEQIIITTLEKNIDIVTLLKKAKKIGENLYSTKLYDTEYLLEIKDDKIEKISFKDQLSNKIEIEFSKIKNNLDFDDSIFMFTIPKNYDVIQK